MQQVRTGQPQWLANAEADWANRDAAGTGRSVVLPAPRVVRREVGGGLLVVVRNPSAVTALLGVVRDAYDDGGTQRWATRTTFDVARDNGDGEAFLIDGGVLGAGTQIVLRNVTELGDADAFRARIAVQVF